MKLWIAILVVAVCATGLYAAEPAPSTLAAMGFQNAQVMTDVDGMQVRGQGFAEAFAAASNLNSDAMAGAAAGGGAPLAWAAADVGFGGAVAESSATVIRGGVSVFSAATQTGASAAAEAGARGIGASAYSFSYAD